MINLRRKYWKYQPTSIITYSRRILTMASFEGDKSAYTEVFELLESHMYTYTNGIYVKGFFTISE